MKNFWKKVLWAVLVLPVSFLLGALAGAAGQAWNAFVYEKLWG